MEIKLINKQENSLALEIDGITEGEVNTLRRMVISEVPTMAIEEVEFIKNDSALFDEIIANRLGLIPLTTDLSIYDEVKESKKKNKTLSQVEFSLSAKGPCTVYSSDLKSTDDKVKPVYDNIPIVKLIDGQELELNAVAILGRGRQHMKFSPGIVYYHHKPILKINNDTKKLEQFKDSFPSNVIKDGKLDEDALLIDNLYEACDGVCDDLLKISYEEDKFIIYVESFGQLDATEMILVALEKLNDKIDEFENALKGGTISEKVIKDAVNAAKKVANLKK